jgi:hypothetical protein
VPGLELGVKPLSALPPPHFFQSDTAWTSPL